jgi:cytochrome P450
MERHVVDFDHHSAEHAADPAADYRRIRETAPITWTESYDGFWIASRYAESTHVARTHAVFSSAKWVDEDGVLQGGLGLPPNRGLQLIPDEVDPPEWEGYRRLLSLAFSPGASVALKENVETTTHEVIDAFIENGHADFVDDLTAPIPALITCDMLGVPRADWQIYAEVFHDSIATPPDDPHFPETVAAFKILNERLESDLAERRANPGDDFFSSLTTAEVNGHLLSDREIIDIMLQLLGGGVDTTTSLLSSILHWLHVDRAMRQRLIDNPDLLPSAREEFLRYFCPVQSTARTVTTETELGGEKLCPGDRILFSYASANRDELEFPDPDELQLDRFPNNHMSFGMGIHRCLGSHIARLIADTVLSAVLERIPDYSLDESGCLRYPDLGTVNGWIHLPATFTPQPRRLSATVV